MTDEAAKLARIYVHKGTPLDVTPTKVAAHCYVLAAALLEREREIEKLRQSLRDTLAAQAQLNARLEARAEALETALRDCSDDLAAEISDRYTPADRAVYPDIRRRYERDMAPVLRARALLGERRDG